MRDGHNVLYAGSGLECLQRNAIAACADCGHNGALRSARDMRLKTALDYALNYVLKFRFRRTCCHIDDHGNAPEKQLANSS